MEVRHTTTCHHIVVNYIIKAKQSSTLKTSNEAKVVSGYSDSITDTYSCDYINKINSYSTEETLTGETWIDGKPIYRRIYSINNITKNVMFSKSIADINYDRIIHLSGTLHSSELHCVPIPYNYDTSSNSCFVQNDKKLYVRISYDADIVYITIKYTKTTD